MNGDTLGWIGFLFSLFIVCWVIWDMLPDAIHTLVRRMFNLSLHIMNWVGGTTWDLLVTLWSGDPRRSQPAGVSTLSRPSPLTYVAPIQADAIYHVSDRGLSGLSAADPTPAAPDPADAYIESLDSGSRQKAVAILVRAGWKAGQIRKVLTGDSGAIGTEVAEARRQLGIDEGQEERKPVSGLPRLADRYNGEAAPPT
jgi:hypothetical protein